MKKIFTVLTVILLLNACSGYFNQNSLNSDQAQTLAVEGGGSLSQEGSDQITPFLHRATNGGDPALFYASNEDGDFDIYYALMNGDGTFKPPVKFIDPLNTPDAETSPVLFWSPDGGGGLIVPFISFIRDSGSGKSLVTYRLQFTNSQFQIMEEKQNDSITNVINNLGLYRDDISTASQIQFYSADSNYNYCYLFVGTGQIYWDVASTYSSPTLNEKFVYSASEKPWEDWSYPYNIDVILYEVQYNGHSQIYLDYEFLDDNLGVIYSAISNIPAQYASSYNDKHPFVDWFDPAGQAKLYFSSDREGDLDLYRYNVDTLKEILPEYPIGEYLSNTGLITNVTGPV